MKFSYFNTVKSASGTLCTPEVFDTATASPQTRELAAEIAKLERELEFISEDSGADAWKKLIGEKKAQLPAVTWQACFPNGRRKSSEAEPSGLYMLDIDHVDNPAKLYSDIIGKRNECDIVYIGMTPSTHGLRVVAECRPEFGTLAECQQWLAGQLGVVADEVCKDYARCSFMVPDEYIYYMDRGIFDREPKCVYKVETKATPKASKAMPSEPPEQQYSNLFGELQKEYDGIAIEDICKVYLQQNGGEPKEGERNAKLYRLALRLRYICDFNEYVMLQNMPRYGLDEEEMKNLIHSANGTNRGQNMPADLQTVINTLKAAKSLKENTVEVVNLEDYSDITDTAKVPPLPPIFKEWYNAAPDDFKVPTIGCLLPILGTLGSKLRAKYFDDNMQSPTFQVSLEAPQASGKSFMRKLAEYCLASVIEHDNAQRLVEKEYNDKRAELKLLNIKVTQKNKEEVLGNKPEVLIRYLPATVSITKFLMRMQQARGLHCFAMAEEIDTVYKAYKKSFSSLSDILRCSFDNVSYGQDYATDTSFSGMVQLYYNTLFSGTPKAMRRFYPDVEDGLVSRVLFITLPDQFGKPYAQWKDLTNDDKKKMDIALLRLNEVSLQGDEVQPDHVMQMDFLCTVMQDWCLKQQQMAVMTKDKTRDTFCRRSAVVGFRAGMIAYYLWNERPLARKNVAKFAIWIANMMLNQHMLRFDLNNNDSNIIPWKRVFDKLPDVFNMNDVINLSNKEDVSSPPRSLIFKWKLAGLITKESAHVFKKEVKK